MTKHSNIIYDDTIFVAQAKIRIPAWLSAKGTNEFASQTFNRLTDELKGTTTDNFDRYKVLSKISITVYDVLRYIADAVEQPLTLGIKDMDEYYEALSIELLPYSQITVQTDDFSKYVYDCYMSIVTRDTEVLDLVEDISHRPVPLTLILAKTFPASFALGYKEL
jgi:hypothetical protein